MKTKKPKLHVVGQDPGGNVYAVECGTGKPHLFTRVVEGKPCDIDGPIGRLQPAGNGGHDVTFEPGEEVYVAPGAERSATGPACVASDDYRDEWDKTFGNRPN